MSKKSLCLALGENARGSSSKGGGVTFLSSNSEFIVYMCDSAQLVPFVLLKQRDTNFGQSANCGRLDQSFPHLPRNLYFFVVTRSTFRAASAFFHGILIDCRNFLRSIESGERYTGDEVPGMPREQWMFPYRRDKSLGHDCGGHTSTWSGKIDLQL